jgi:hypothetical protein
MYVIQETAQSIEQQAREEINLSKERPKSLDREMSKSKSTNNFLNLSLDLKNSYVEIKSSLHNIAVLRSPVKRRSSCDSPINFNFENEEKIKSAAENYEKNLNENEKNQGSVILESPSKDYSSAESEGIINNEYSDFNLSESMALSHAREILAFCNRTQSGGDTYFCIDALLRDKEKDFSILTPLGVEADPLEIVIDVIEAKFLPPQSSPQRQSTDSTASKDIFANLGQKSYEFKSDEKGTAGHGGGMSGFNADGSRVKLSMVSQSRSIKKGNLFKNRKIRSLDDCDVDNDPMGGDKMSKGLKGLFFNHKSEGNIGKSLDLHEGKNENVHYSSLHSSLTVTSEEKQLLLDKKLLYEKNSLMDILVVNSEDGENQFKGDY